MSDEPRSTSDRPAASRDTGSNGSADGTDGASETTRSDRPQTPRRTNGAGADNLFTRFRTAQSGPLLLLREVVTSLGAVIAVGLLLFAISGVWPPMVAVESGSMNPHMQKGDLVFITEPDRFTPDAGHSDTGVVTAKAGREVNYRSFGGYGSVVVYDSPGRLGPPIIHRAHFWVGKGENWYDEANPDYVRGDGCRELPNCPAPHAGFITKGDANSRYDQVSGISGPVRPSWVTGVARIRVPYLGWIRLGLSQAAGGAPAAVVPVTQGPASTDPTAPTAEVGISSGPASDERALSPTSLERTPSSTSGGLAAT